MQQVKLWGEFFLEVQILIYHCKEFVGRGGCEFFFLLFFVCHVHTFELFSLHTLIFIFAVIDAYVHIFDVASEDLPA